MKVIVATDGLKHSLAAVEFISSIGLKESDEVLLFTIIDLALPAALGAGPGDSLQTIEVENRFRKQAEETLEAASARLRELIGDNGANVASEISFGSPQRRIVEKAEEIGADLVVVGSHLHNTWERLLLGSVSDAVVHQAPCSVLVVRD